MQSQRYRDSITGIMGPIRPLAFVLNLKHEAGKSFRPQKVYQFGIESHCVKLHKANFKKETASGNKLKVDTVLLLRQSDKPRGIDVDPCEKKIYFTNWNMEAPSIQRCSYNGYGVESIVTTDIR